MVLFSLNAQCLFISAHDRNEILVWETDSLYSCKLRQSNWRSVDKVNVRKDELETGVVVIRGQKLKELAVDLYESQLTVNCDGCCYLFTGVLNGRAGPLVVFHTEFYRLNDFFGWSKYGVVPSIIVNWNKYDLYTNSPVNNHIEEHQSLKATKLHLEEKRKELSLGRRHLEEKEQELKDCVSRLKEKEKENKKDLCVSGKHLEQKGEELEDYRSRLNDMERELAISEMRIEEKDQALKKMTDQLLAEQKRASPLRVAVNSLVHSLNDLNASLQNELFDSDDLLPTFSRADNASSLDSQRERASSSNRMSQDHRADKPAVETTGNSKAGAAGNSNSCAFVFYNRILRMA